MRDDEVVKAVLAGDSDSYDILVRRYLPSIYRYSLRMLGSAADAEDVAQETFVKAWRSLSRFRTGENLRTWLLRIARNTAIDTIRTRRDVPFAEFGEYAETLAESTPDVEPLPDEIAARLNPIEALRYE